MYVLGNKMLCSICLYKVIFNDIIVVKVQGSA
jgi:hypothetical protein